MLTRVCKLPESLDFFLFGPRSTGKTTLLEATFSDQKTVFFNLLDPDTFDRFRDSPQAFENALNALPSTVERVVVDEIQKSPNLLDIVQKFIQKKRFKFSLTGSSARKLKRGHANLLGGRAVTRNLWPLTFLEYESVSKDIDARLHWGSLPDVLFANTDEERADKLLAYVRTYLAEEVVAEQLVRNLTPFRRFLAVAAQMNGKIINTNNIGKDIGTSHNTVASYFEILEDTLIGFSLPVYHASVRKRVKAKSKFYLFDTGVCRAMGRILDFPPSPSTSYYGDLFEHHVICEIFRLAQYLKPNWELYFYQTTAGNEIDLIIDKGMGEPILIEIKSATQISKISLKDEITLMKDFNSTQCYVLSLDPVSQILDKNIKAMFWEEGIKEIFEV